MFKSIIKAIYSAFISILLISTVLAGWTTYSLFFQTSKSSDIVEVMQDMYASQKSVIIDVIDLTKILIKDTSDKITNENKDVFVERELLTDRVEDYQLEQPSITEDNGENPLGIVIQQSLPEASETGLQEKIEEQLLSKQNESSMSEMKNEMEMNS